MKKILLVNNQEAFLDRNKTLLNRAGFLILTATSTKDAIEVCREQPVDLIIAQLDLPSGRGDALCTYLRSDDTLKNVSIILVCYQSEMPIATGCGANAVVTKPVRPEELLKLVGKFLGIRARREYRAVFNARLEGTCESCTFSGMTHNVSASGMLCESDMQLKEDDHLTNLLFNLDSCQVVTDGKVVWTARCDGEAPRYGVQFVDLAPELRDKIEEFVTAAAPPDPA